MNLDALDALDADVVVVGCGPVGIMAALRCSQRGLRVVAVERDKQVYPLPRAIGMDDEIQDLMARAGLIDQLRAHSTPSGGGDFVDAAGKRVVGVEIPPGTTGALGHPPMTMFDQPSVEAFLRRAAIEAGVDLRLGTELIGFSSSGGPGDSSVLAKLSNGPKLQTRWMIGADGARSFVRDALGVQLVDQEFDQQWLVVDTTLLDPDLPLPTLARQHCDPARVVTFVPGHGTRRRWEFQLKDHETREQALEPNFLEELLRPWGDTSQLQIDRVAVYRFHGVVAERFRSGNVFLAGDAAHQMPPFNGQGMCSGMRDAENLAWKLAAVAQGHSDASLLDSYDSERRPHASQQVAHSVDAGKLIDAIAYGGEQALESGYGRRKFPRVEHGIVDGEHRWTGAPLPQPFDRSFDIGNGWTLLHGPHSASSTSAASPLWQRVGVTEHALGPDTYGDQLSPDQSVIVRPDRLVAAVTTDLAATSASLAARMNG